MAGVTLATALYGAEGDGSREALGMEDMEFRIKAQVRGEMLGYFEGFGHHVSLAGAVAS